MTQRCSQGLTFFALVLGCGVLCAGDADKVCAPASLSVVVQPEAAAGQVQWQVATVKDGDQWVVNPDPGAWLASGATRSGLQAGYCAVVFQTAGRWAAPDPMPIQVCGGSSRKLDVIVPEASIYATVDDIPAQVVRHGDTLSFFVEEGGSIDPAGVGEKDIHFESGRFEYRPGEEKGQFKLTFNGPGGSSNKVLFDVLPILPAEQTVIEYQGAFPDPESLAYLNVTKETENNISFNYAIRTVRDVQVTGVHVILKKDHGQGLYELLAYEDVRKIADVRSLQIYADQVIVGDRIHLPGTAVTIHARELIFEDPTEGEPAAIVTTPLELLNPPPNLGYPITDQNGLRYNEDGKPGLPAGNIVLNVSAVVAPGSAIRLDLKGGRGQDGVDGWNGEPLADRAVYSWIWDDTWPAEWYARVFCIKYDCCCGCICDDSWQGPPGCPCPRSGVDAVGDGASGRGGNGGSLSTPFPLGGHYRVLVGAYGRATEDHTGSLGDWPPSALKLIQSSDFHFFYCDWHGFAVWGEPCTNRDGYNSPKKNPIGDNPHSGTVSANLDPLAWLHPLSIRAVLQHARDLYLNGYPDDARALLEPYGAALKAVVVTEPDADDFAQFNLGQVKAEVSTILHRLDNHLDYYGYPLGWVPMLSFEVELQLFRDEVAAAGDILYVTYYLGLAANDAEKRKKALDRLRAELSKSVDDQKAKLQDAAARLQSVRSQAEALDRDIRDLGVRLKAREEVLKEKAERFALLKKAFRVAARVLPMIPIGQPALGLIGTGLGAASKFNEQSALDCAIEGTNAASEFIKSNMEATMDKFKTVMDAPDPRAGLLLVGLQNSYEMFDAGISGVNQVLQEAKTWEDDVNKEVQILAAEDETCKGLVKEIESLNKRKRQFVEEMAATAQFSLDLMDGIKQAILALENLNRDAVKNQGKIDQEAFRAVKEMEQRAKDRLLKYQYYLIKSYHYRMLRPFEEIDPDAFQILEVYQHFQEHFTDTIPSIAGQSILPTLVTFYTDQLREITAKVVERLSNDGPSKTDPIYVEISANVNRELLDQLNSFDGPAAPTPPRLNLYDLGRFTQDQEDLRISSLSVDTLEVRPRSGTVESDLVLKIEHSGESLIGYRGETYRFLHHRTVKDPPIHWRTKYNAAKGTHEDTRISDASGSLLASLLEGEDFNDIVLYSRPSAWADLILTKETLRPPDVEMMVEKLILKVEVDYYTKERQQAELHVRMETANGLELTAPLVLVGDMDKKQRKDGRGRFQRVFNPGNEVELEAPLQYGAYEFYRWVYFNPKGQQVTSEDPLVSIPLPTTDAPTITRVRAVYRPLPSSTPFRRGDANADGKEDISDAVTVLGFLFLGNPAALACDEAADVDDDGALAITDSIVLLNFLFLGGETPGEPFGACGIDPSYDTLTCGSFSTCAAGASGGFTARR